MGGIWMAGPSVAGSGRAVSSRGFYVFPPMTLQYRARWERERGTWKLYHCCTEGQQSALRIQQCNAPIGPNSQAPTPPFPGELLPPPPFLPPFVFMYSQGIYLPLLVLPPCCSERFHSSYQRCFLLFHTQVGVMTEPHDYIIGQ